MKHKIVKKLLNNPDSIMAEDIAQYAIFNTTDNDNTKFKNIVELIVQYTSSVCKQDSQPKQTIYKTETVSNTDERRIKLSNGNGLLAHIDIADEVVSFSNYHVKFKVNELSFDDIVYLATVINNLPSRAQHSYSEQEVPKWISVDLEADIADTELQHFEQYFIVVAESGNVIQANFCNWETEGVENTWIICDEEYPLSFASHYQRVIYPAPPKQ